MKLEFEEPKMDLIILDEEDVITTSGGNGSGKIPNGWNNPNNPHYYSLDEEDY